MHLSHKLASRICSLHKLDMKNTEMKYRNNIPIRHLARNQLRDQYPACTAPVALPLEC
jgi:hypothetical protein